MKECQLCKNCFADDVGTCPNDGMPTVHTIAGDPVLEGKYQLECRLGQGGMGVVYKARHAYLKTQLAIKVILPDLVGNDPQLVTRFRQEALAAAAIRHQNVVSVTDYGVIEGSVPFLVMEYVEGESLHDLLAREKFLSPERALELMTAICGGVGAAHHQGIVHRDLKPLNIMICNNKPDLSAAVKILDFGLAKIKSGELLGSFIQAQTTGLMGSPYYMAPEQWADEEPDSRSDIYSLGVMLFQMLAGDVPFKGSSIPAIMKKHISDPAPTFASLGVHMSADVEAAVLHTLEKDKNKRTPSVEAMVNELRYAVHGASAIHTSAIHNSASTSLPVSSLVIKTRPPQASVYVDNVSVGRSPSDGVLTLEGVQSGNHHLRVTLDGFEDWLGDVVCDGKPQEVVVDLSDPMSASRVAIPKPGFDSFPALGLKKDTNNIIQLDPATKSEVRLDPAATVAATSAHNWPTDTGNISVGTIPKKKSAFSPIVLGIGSIFALFILGVIGVGAAYWFGLIGSPGPNIGNSNSNSVSPTPKQGVVTKLTMVEIPGGTFKMGRDDEAVSYPAHDVTVKDFAMSKTEITNAQYLEFVTATNHEPPKHWIDKKPVAGRENWPVAFVTHDDAVAYAKWRSEVDNVKYRLPTEEEWEYAARNGSKENLYPWGDKWVDTNAVIGKSVPEPSDVGSTPTGANLWGVQDLIGNVWEWTDSAAKPYPGAEKRVDVTKNLDGQFVIRGGSANENPTKIKITSTFRSFVPVAINDKTLGFRVVSDR